MSIRKKKWKSGGKIRAAWVLDYVDEHGKRRQKTFHTKMEAKSAEAKFRYELSVRRHVDAIDQLTVNGAIELWAKSREGGDLEEATKLSYQSIVKYNILPFIGTRLLNDFYIQDVLRFEDELKNTPYPPDFPSPRKRGRLRSRDAVRRATMVLGAIFATAQLHGKATHNPVYAIPRRKRPYRKTDREKVANKPQVGVDIPTLEEIGLILDHVCGRYWRLIVVVIFSGLRASELRGLRWIDIDFKRGVIQVRQRANFRGRLGPPKSKAGFRTIPVPPYVLQMLSEWKDECSGGSLGLVFPTKRGTVPGYQVIIRCSLRPTMKRAGLMVDKGRVDKNGNKVLSPKYTLHALRHFYASWCINRVEDGGLGLMVKQVQERMGHANIQITMDTYGHLFPIRDEGEALARAERLLRRNKDATRTWRRGG
ncbi:tyrosine-type recombinase/integrase [Mesorhizobium sp. KR2-14]|uniref:tyrosine-type recombinase/integrase n=1 Tax=Mesorhizobium sp. KR2-14 TaxID=3156610 RepID=UPI0032B5625A